MQAPQVAISPPARPNPFSFPSGCKPFDFNHPKVRNTSGIILAGFGSLFLAVVVQQSSAFTIKAILLSATTLCGTTAIITTLALFALATAVLKIVSYATFDFKRQQALNFCEHGNLNFKELISKYSDLIEKNIITKEEILSFFISLIRTPELSFSDMIAQRGLEPIEGLSDLDKVLLKEKYIPYFLSNYAYRSGIIEYLDQQEPWIQFFGLDKADLANMLMQNEIPKRLKNSESLTELEEEYQPVLIKYGLTRELVFHSFKAELMSQYRQGLITPRTVEQMLGSGFVNLKKIYGQTPMMEIYMEQITKSLQQSKPSKVEEAYTQKCAASSLPYVFLIAEIISSLVDECFDNHGALENWQSQLFLHYPAITKMQFKRKIDAQAYREGLNRAKDSYKYFKIFLPNTKFFKDSHHAIIFSDTFISNAVRKFAEKKMNLDQLKDLMGQYWNEREIREHLASLSDFSMVHLYKQFRLKTRDLLEEGDQVLQDIDDMTLCQFIEKYGLGLEAIGEKTRETLKSRFIEQIFSSHSLSSLCYRKNPWPAFLGIDMDNLVRSFIIREFKAHNLTYISQYEEDCGFLKFDLSSLEKELYTGLIQRHKSGLISAKELKKSLGKEYSLPKEIEIELSIGRDEDDLEENDQERLLKAILLQAFLNSYTGQI